MIIKLFSTLYNIHLVVLIPVFYDSVVRFYGFSRRVIILRVL